jgi:hypothetical protein
MEVRTAFVLGMPHTPFDASGQPPLGLRDGSTPTSRPGWTGLFAVSMELYDCCRVYWGFSGCWVYGGVEMEGWGD